MSEPRLRPIGRAVSRQQVRRLPLGARRFRASLATIVLASALVTPLPALASRLESDRIAGVPLSAGSVAISTAPDVAAKAGRLVASDGQLLWSRRSTSRRAMASTTKIMTAVLALDRCNLDEKVRVSRAASRVGYATGLRTGEHRTVRELLELSLVASSNDAATALAIHMGGSISGFASMMNTRAVQLGLEDTHYVNPHGLDATGHYTSAADLTRLLQVAMKRSEFQRIVKLKSVKLPAYRTRPARTIKATNKLLGVVEGLEGGKTGFTDDAGYCLVARASRGGVTLTSVVLGSSSSTRRFESSETLLEWGFKHYKLQRLASASQTAGSVRLAANPSLTVPVRFAETTSTVIFDLLGPVNRRHSLPARVSVPVYAGQQLGEVRFLQGSSLITTMALVASKSRASAEETVGAVPVSGYLDRSVAAKTAESTATVAPYDAARPVERVVILQPEVTPPVAAGERLGTVSYTQDGRLIVAVPVVAAETVEPAGIIEQAEGIVRRGWTLLVGS